MHRLITDDPDWQALQRDRQQISQAAEIHRRQSEAEQAEYRRLLAEHTLAKEQALMAGLPAPEAPPPPKTDPADTHIFIGRIEQCDLRERQWLGAAATRLERRLHDRETELLGDANAAVTRLRAIATEVSELTSTVAKIRASAGDSRPVHRRAVTATDLVGAVEQGRRFLSNLLPEGDIQHGGFRSVANDDDVARFEPAARRPSPRPVNHRREGRR